MSPQAGVRVQGELDAVVFVEGRICDRVHWASRAEEPPAPRWPDKNAWGAPCTVQRTSDVEAALHSARDDHAVGKRAAVVADARGLVGARETLEVLVKAKVGLVVHAVGAGGSAAREAFALADLGVGVLFAAGPEDALDLTLVARRAAEDAGTPIVVVHELPASHAVETVKVPSDAAIADYAGAPSQRLKSQGESTRSLGAVARLKQEERIPFALGSAMRDLEPHTGRRHDVVERVLRDDADIVVFGAGSAGDAALGVAEQLRDAGASVAAVRLVALRPYPGPRVVKAVSRAQVVCVLEPGHQPLAQSGPLACELKSAFADAMTWATGYPGVGRLPRVVSSAADFGDLESAHVAQALASVAEQGERGVRLMTFVPGAVASAHPRSSTRVVVRALVSSVSVAEACAPLVCELVARATGLAVAATARRLGDDAALDVVIARERPRAGMAPLALDAVMAQSSSLLERTAPLAGLVEGGLVLVGSKGNVPPSPALLFEDRGARVASSPLPSAKGDEATKQLVAATSGLACAAAVRIARAPIEAAELDRLATELLGAKCGAIARAAMG